MHPKNTLLYTLVFLLMAGAAQGQWCGTVAGAAPEGFDFTPYVDFRGNATDSVGLAIHLLAKGQNTEAAYQTLLTSLDWINDAYAGAGLYFFICDWEVLEGEHQYLIEDVDALNETLYSDHRLNIYIIERIIGSAPNVVGYSKFPWMGERSERYVGLTFEGLGYPEVIAHEIGHYYGLYHTHENMFGREWVDHSNCATAGDKICDTPADPGLGPHNLVGCDYIGGRLDPSGSRYFPHTDLIMSYAPRACVQRFSEEQLGVIRSTASTLYHDMVSNCDNLPDIWLTNAAQPMTIDFRETISLTVHVGNNFNSHVTSELGVYLIQPKGTSLIRTEPVLLTAGQDSVPVTFSVTLPKGTASGSYTLMIKADSKRRILESDERNNTVLIPLTVDNSRFDDALLFPNPATDHITLFYRNEKAKGQIDLEIYDSMGRLVEKRGSLPWATEFHQYLDISALTYGVYTVQLYDRNRGRLSVLGFVKG